MTQSGATVDIDSEQLEALLSRLVDAPYSRAKDGPVNMRMRYLQRHDFPPGAKTGRGKRASYDLERILQTAVALALLDVGIPPSRVICGMTDRWDSIRAACAQTRAAHRSDAYGSNETASSVHRYLLVEPSAVRGDDGAPAMELGTPESMASSLLGTVPNRPRIVLDLLQVVTAVENELKHRLRRRDDDVDEAFERLLPTGATLR